MAKAKAAPDQVADFYAFVAQTRLNGQSFYFRERISYPAIHQVLVRYRGRGSERIRWQRQACYVDARRVIFFLGSNQVSAGNVQDGAFDSLKGLGADSNAVTSRTGLN